MTTKPLRILLVTDFMVLLAAAMLIPFYSSFVDSIGGSLLDAGIAASVFAVVAGLTSLGAGLCADRIRRRLNVIMVCYVLLALSFVGYIFVSNIWQLLVVQASVGLTSAFYQPAYDALYMEYVGGKKRAGTRWSLWESANYFSLAVGSLLGALLVKAAGFSWLFIAMASLCAASALYLFLVARRSL